MHQVVHAAPHHLACHCLDTREPRLDRARDVVPRAAGDGIVKLAAYQRAPRELEQRPAVASSRTPRQCGQGFGQPHECELGGGIAALERRAVACTPWSVHA